MKLLLKFAGVALCFASTQLLHANPVLITLSSTAHNFSFSLDSQPTPDGPGTDSRSDVFFFFNDGALTEDGVTRNEGVGFSRSPTGRRQFDIGGSFFLNADGSGAGSTYSKSLRPPSPVTSSPGLSQILCSHRAQRLVEL